MNRRLLPWLALAAVVLATVAFVAWPRGGDPTPAEHARTLADEFRCPDCQGLSAADSSTPTARAIRADIRDRIEAGQSDAEIRRAMADRFGESILLKPEGEGIGLLVWGLPVAVVVVAGAGLALALRRWRRQPAPAATDADRALVEQARGGGRTAIH